MSNDPRPDEDFREKQKQARVEINKLDADRVHDEPERIAFFNAVYQRAGRDAINVPWADLHPKDKLLDWLKDKKGQDQTALDIACGLGDNAEAIAEYGYQTAAFDVAADAILWAKKRFPESLVQYRQADLFDPPSEWLEKFDLVHECYTLQALPPKMFEKSARAVANLVKPGGTLLVYTRILPEPREQAGPPWPLIKDQAEIFFTLGFKLVSEDIFTIDRPDRQIPHGFYEWKKMG
ncbi:MAG: methyltransferase type 11 [Hyphomicrobiales bacterium]|nr:MAG: methyltransferase type 11 [Hyphomicrobiales bacterium]